MAFLDIQTPEPELKLPEPPLTDAPDKVALDGGNPGHNLALVRATPAAPRQLRAAAIVRDFDLFCRHSC